jgi:hypothetical protein
VTEVKSLWTERTGRYRLYSSRCLVPAIWVKREPLLRRWAKVSRKRGSWQLLWRAPWDGRDAVGPPSRINRLTRGLLR